MASSLRELLPAPASDQDQHSSIKRGKTLRSKSPHVVAACDNCRRKKTKCTKRGAQCVFFAHQGETSALALKRKFVTVKEENEQFRELLLMMQTRPLEEAQAIFTRIRTLQDPREVLRLIKEAQTLLPHQNPSELKDTNSRVLQVDQEALLNASIKVHAQPWTVVAGDGVVSELITEFFANDHLYFYPTIDRELFLQEMRNCDIQSARYCSPLLVNAICAHRCFWSRSAKIMGSLTHLDMVERFIQESKKLLDNENGRATVPNVLALYFMYGTLTFQGRDRAGNIYRYLMIDMLRRLDLQRQYYHPPRGNSDLAQHQRVISRAFWGLFIYESRISSMYRHPSFIRPPTIPRRFENIEQDISTSQQNIDILGRPYVDSTAHAPQVPGILHASCDMSELFYEVTTHNCHPPQAWDIELDISFRENLYLKWNEWNRQLPDLFRTEKNFTPQTCWLRSHANEVALSILQPLNSAIILKNEKVTVKEFSLQHCQDEIIIADSFMKKWSPDGLIGRGQFIVLSTLVPFLEDDRTHGLFTAACQLLRFTTTTIPIMKVFLQGIKALAWRLDQVIPATARPYFEGLKLEKDVADLPTSFQLPHLRALQALAADEDDSAQQTSNEIARLIAQWSALTVEL